MQVAKSTETCLWCRETVLVEEAVWIERQHDDDGEEPWHGFFCGNEHAAAWVADPSPPPDVVRPGEETWADHLFAVGCVIVLLLLLTLFVIGVVIGSAWVLDRLV